MCGIVGFTGQRQAAPILLEGLRKLEYRGYDSAGIAVQGQQEIQVVKVSGQIDKLFEKTDEALYESKRHGKHTYTFYTR